MRTLQEWMGHRDIQTRQRYADYAPAHDEAATVARAFAPRGVEGISGQERDQDADYPARGA